MDILEAIEMVANNSSVAEIQKNGYFLVSCFALLANEREIGEWTLHFYNSGKGISIDCFVNKDKINVAEQTPALGESQKLDINNLKVSAYQALNSALDDYKGNPINILITLHMKDGKPTWTINMVAMDMTVISYNIDATTGELRSKESTSLIRKL